MPWGPLLEYEGPGGCKKWSSVNFVLWESSYVYDRTVLLLGRHFKQQLTTVSSMFSSRSWRIINNWNRIWRSRQICFQENTGCYLEINFRTLLSKWLKLVKTQKICSNRWIKGNCSPFTMTLFRKKSLMMLERGVELFFFFFRRPDPDNGVASTSCHRQGSSGKNSLQKLPFLQHTSGYFL